MKRTFSELDDKNVSQNLLKSNFSSFLSLVGDRAKDCEAEKTLLICYLREGEKAEGEAASMLPASKSEIVTILLQKPQ